jgi:hypothetical protein
VDDILRRLRLQRLQLISHPGSSVAVVGCCVGSLHRAATRPRF